MSKQPTIEVTPIFGWGWVIEGQPRFQIPTPFSVSLENSEPTRWAGVVMDNGHEFSGRRVILSQRHAEWDGHVNIEVEPAASTGKATIGFGQLEKPPSSVES